MENRGEKRISFTVPAANGDYAPEVLYCNGDNEPKALMDLVVQLSLLVESLPADAVIEVDLLKAGLAGSIETNWQTAVKSFDSTGLQDFLQLAMWRGVRVRAKSGGTAGTAVVSASWW